MKQYLELVQNLLDHGCRKQEGTGTGMGAGNRRARAPAL